MMEFCVNKEELLKALDRLEVAEKNGFADSLAVLRLRTAGECLDEFTCTYEAVILKAHPTDANLNWGRSKHPEWSKFENGQIKDVE